MGVSKKKTRKKLTKGQLKKRGKVAEKLKGKPGIRNPFAVATNVVKKKARRR